MCCARGGARKGAGRPLGSKSSYKSTRRDQKEIKLDKYLSGECERLKNQVFQNQNELLHFLLRDLYRRYEGLVEKEKTSKSINYNVTVLAMEIRILAENTQFSDVLNDKSENYSIYSLMSGVAPLNDLEYKKLFYHMLVPNIADDIWDEDEINDVINENIEYLELNDTNFEIVSEEEREVMKGKLININKNEEIGDNKGDKNG
jgi:hypothetical protein